MTPAHLGRINYTGDLGYEIWVAPEHQRDAVRPDRRGRRAARPAAVRDAGADVAAAREELRDLVPRVPADLHVARGRARRATSSSTTSSSAGRRTRPRWRRRAEAAARRRSSSSPTRTTRPTSSATSRSGTTARSSAGSRRAATATTSGSRSRWATCRRSSPTPDGPGGTRLRDRDHRPAPAGPAPARAAVRPAGSPDAPVTESVAAGGGSSSTARRSRSRRATRSPSRSSAPARCRVAAAASASPATAATASPRSTASRTSGPARSRRGPGRSSGGIPRDGEAAAAGRRPATTSTADADRSRGRGRDGSTPARGRRSARSSGRRAAPDGARVLDAADGHRGRRDLPGAGDRRPRARRDAPRRRRRVVVATGRGRAPAGLPGQRPRRDRDRRAPPSGSARPASISGRVVRVGRELVRFEGDDDGRVAAVVTRGADGSETTTPCDTAVVDLGRAPRDVLARMARRRRASRVVGSAADDHPLPPRADRPGVVCPCMGTTVDDLEAAWDQRLHASSSCSSAPAGPGSGRARAAPACRTSGRSSPPGPATVPEPFTARPGRPPDHARRGRRRRRRSTPSGGRRSTTSTSPLGARMDRFGGWWRPWHYGDVVGEYWAVREGVSIGDVSTLGKLVVSGPDVVEALERIYPCHVADIKPGRSRYALLLNERGHVMDDGMILRDAETRFTLTFTSGGAANAEMWLRDWIDTWGLRVHVMDRTMSLAAINVTGPLAGELLRRLGLAEPPRFLGHVRAEIAGVPCHVMRLSFTGEAAFELHHPVDRLGRAVAGADGRGPRPRDPAARPPGAVRAAAREGPRDRRHGHRARHDAAAARHGLGGPDGEAVRSSAGRRSSGPRSSTTSGAGSGSRWTARRRRRARRSGRSTTARSIGNVTGSWTSPLLGRALMLGWQRRRPVRRPGRDRRPRGGRDADAVLRPGGRPCPRLSRVGGRPGRRRARRRSTRAALGRRRRRRPPDRARTRRSGSGATGVAVDDDPDAIVEPEAGFVGRAAGPRRARARSRRTPTGRCPRRRRAARPGQDRRRPGEARSSAIAGRCSSIQPPTPTSSERGSDGAEPMHVARRPSPPSSRSSGTSRARPTTS